LTHINGYSVINNSGVVAYSGGGDFGGGIFTTAGRSVLRGESLHDIEIYGLSAILDLNDSGNVLFLHFDPAGAEALMTFDGVIARSGQQLAGGTVQNLMPFGLNNRGQVLFGAYLTSGVSTLVLATPVPEPATYTTAVTALVVIAGARRRRMEAARTKT
jgi:hypothetical protein